MNARTENAESLQRIQRDLSTLQQAAGLGLPFGREVVWFWLTVALGAGTLALVAAWGGAAQKLAAIAFFAVVTSALFLGVLVRGVRAVRDRAVRPAPWREYRTITTAKAIVLPFVIAFFVIQGMLGAPPLFLAATATFLVGLVCLVYGISNWARRPAVGLAIPIMAFAAWIPALTTPQITVGAPLCAAIASLATASLLAWQLARARE
jgi:hypothetical protein